MHDLQLGLRQGRGKKCATTYVGHYKTKQSTSVVDCQHVRKDIDGGNTLDEPDQLAAHCKYDLIGKFFRFQVTGNVPHGSTLNHPLTPTSLYHKNENRPIDPKT